ncbi:MAG: rhodanese-like domain-containing protein [Deltaproteobacteria bacterium]|nr:MAG: rhodanese-like domain-containing protein [Deltaproteobacteria bacterium]
MFPLFLALTFGCGNAAPPAAPTPGVEAGAQRDIDVDALAADLDAKKVPILVDVRTPAEFAEGHVPGAVNIPLDEIGGRTSELESHKDGEIYLVCRSGGRSARAAGELAAKGFDTVNVSGGTLAWQASGRPTE